MATIAATLPVCRVRQAAYSTFTIIRIENNREAELIQYDNPRVILLRHGKRLEYAETEQFARCKMTELMQENQQLKNKYRKKYVNNCHNVSFPKHSQANLRASLSR